MRPKINELDVVRAIAIIAVVLIHSTSEATVLPAAGSLLHKFFYWTNTLGAFAVPVFVIISGIVLFYKYYDQWTARDSITFYKKRVISVVYPYLAFSIFYYLFNQILFSQTVTVDIGAFLNLLPWGKAGYHLYYMILICQFYLLFPILMTLTKKSRLFERNLALIGLLIQGGFYVYVHWFHNIPHRATLSVTYFALFLIGAVIGIHYHTIVKWIERHTLWLMPLAILTGCLYVGLNWSLKYDQVPIETTWIMLAYNTYALLMAVALIGAGKHLMKLSPKVSTIMLRLGKASFGVYLLHPAILSLYKRFFPPSGGVAAFSFNILGGFLTALLLTWLLVEIYYLLKKRIMPSKKKSMQ
ncbi:acyltransferase [Paenibacillus albiflavus]|uniref:Acyltransferase n=1 Tax=Paenibacillus albiflavus TaxID=2545760 RepID=A0A4R4ED01_9BACL|nr:acyltransferase [Paenibacillus albiflavus]TCZ76870.1 acyltransferase [Paenibacillus albiflavus]